jgi:hypothetical protein
MPWTTRCDATPCCGASPGCVNDNEPIARLLHSRIADPLSAAFNRDQLTRPDKPFSNVCGEADGCSVDRVAKLTQTQIRTRAVAMATLKDGRSAQGAVVALVSDLRAIPWPADPKGQAVYVYDDPMDTNPEHALIRVSQHVSRAEFQVVRKAILAAFKHKVEQA